jgi:hypothetical protein
MELQTHRLEHTAVKIVGQILPQETFSKAEEQQLGQTQRLFAK